MPFILALAVAATLIFLPVAYPQQSCIIETFAGVSDWTPGDGGPALEAPIAALFDGSVAPDGSIFFTDSSARAIRRIRPNGEIETLHEQASDQSLIGASWMDVGRDGSVYFKDGIRIRRVLPSGVVTVVAGNGAQGSAQDGTMAAEAPHLSSGLAVGPDGAVYFAEPTRHRVRRIAPDGRMSTVAGKAAPDARGRVLGGFSGDGGPALAADLNRPQDVALGPDGALYVADGGNNRIRIISPDGVIRTIAGGGLSGNLDGSPALEVLLRSPDRVAVTAGGIVFFSDTTGVYRIDGEGTLRSTPAVSPGFGFFVGPDGSLYHLANAQSQRIAPDGATSAIAGVAGSSLMAIKEGPALASSIRPYDLAVGPSGDLYVAHGETILAISPSGALRRVAGGGERVTETQEGLDAREAFLDNVANLAVDREERIYFSERGFSRIRSVEPDGKIGFVAGRFQRGGCRFDEVCGVGGPARDAILSAPTHLFAGSDGSLYLVDSYNSPDSSGRTERILRINPAGMLAETPITPDMREREFLYSLAFAASAAQHPTYAFHYPFSVNHPVPFFRLEPDGTSTPIAGSRGYANPGLDAVLADDGSIYFTTDDYRIRKALPDGRVVTIAGQAEVRSFAGDGGPARFARFRELEGLALGPDGALYIADLGNRRVRRIREVASCDHSPKPEIALSGAVHAADFRSFDSFGAAPGMIFSIFGRSLGPAQPVTARVENGRLATQLAGVRVMVDGAPAPLVFVASHQINAIAPYATKARHDVDRDGAESYSGRSFIEVQIDGISSEPFPIYTQTARPGIFLVEPGVSQRGAIFNQDGTLNGPDNPAKVGSVVVLYATGEGETSPPGVDGLLALDALPGPVAPVTIRIADVEAAVLYAGAAPTFTAGLMQANARIEPGTPSGPQQLTLRIGVSETSAPVWIAP